MIERLLEAWRPSVGWPTFLAVLAAGLCFPLAIYAGDWVDGSGVLVVLGLAGGIVGNWLASQRRPSALRRREEMSATEQGSHWRMSDRRTWSLGLVAGGVITFVVIGQTLPHISTLYHGYRSAEAPAAGSDFLSELIRTIEPLLQALWIYWREAALRNLAFASQIARWIQTALGGGVSRDNDIFLLWTGWLSWSVVFHSVAAFIRQQRPAVALAPLGLAVTVAAAADPDGNGWVYVFVGLGTVLWSFGAHLQWERRWVEQQTDYSPELRLDIAMTGSLLAVLVAGAAFTLALGLPWAGALLRRPLAVPTERVSTTLDRLFGGVHRPPITAAAWRQANFSDLPLTRVLAGPPELRDDPVLRVTTTKGQVAVSPLYWRGLTYDKYTGRGWANSASDTVRRPPQPIHIAHLGPETTQQIKMLIDTDPVRYAIAQPIRVDVGATWVTRASGDLVGWYADAVEYVAASRPTMASVEELRDAPSDYPVWIVEHYLQLPIDLPERVRRRAEEIVGNAATAYDKAAAIEGAMRSIPYSLEVGLPPPDRDIVDYFLFDMDAGYCDYFATTMAVLARAVGVPARVATGYATGTYDPELGFYVVTGLDAHAWVEVFFPDIGWVPFEPTPARAAIERSPAPPPVPDQSERTAGPVIGPIGVELLALGLIALALAGGGLGLWIIRRSRTHDLAPEDRVRTAYDTLWQRAGWFGWNGRASQTPWERIEALQDALANRSVEVTLGDRRFLWRGADAVEDLRQLGMLFVKAQYSRQGVTLEEALAADGAWRRVRWRLILLWRLTSPPR